MAGENEGNVANKGLKKMPQIEYYQSKQEISEEPAQNETKGSFRHIENSSSISIM